MISTHPSGFRRDGGMKRKLTRVRITQSVQTQPNLQAFQIKDMIAK